jgi:hypothetical protein
MRNAQETIRFRIDRWISYGAPVASADALSD